MISEERNRQVEQEKWSNDHDDSHDDESLACAAACYAMPERFRNTRKRGLWRWASRWWKPTPDNRIRELVKAGALIAAEIDRIHRTEQKGTP